MIINLFLPKKSNPPYQTVIYFPGCAVAYPVYKGTFERRDERLLAIHLGTNTYQYSEFLTQLVKDFRRTIDYLETRPDIDAGRLAYYGMSLGGAHGRNYSRG